MDQDKIKIIDADYMSRLKASFDDCLFYDEWQVLYDFVRKFEPPLNENSKQIPEEFRGTISDMIIEAKWVCLPSLSQREILDLFRNHFMVQVKLSERYYDLWGKLRAKLIMIPIYEDRDSFRHKVRDSLLENKELITTRGPLDSENNNKKPTIGNWLSDYNTRMGNKDVQALELNSYIVKHPVINLLKERERINLKNLFNFYEIVKKSSFEPEGYEETISIYDPELGPCLLEAGRLIPLGKDNISETKNFIKKLNDLGIYPFDPDKLDKFNLQRENNLIKGDDGIKSDSYNANHVVGFNVEQNFQQVFGEFLSSDLISGALKQKEVFSQQFGSDLKKLRNQFYHSINEKQVEQALGAFLTIVSSGKTRQLFEADDRFIKFWSEYLAKNDLDAEHFKNDPAGARYVAMFLKYILEKRLNLNGKKAVLFGVLVSNLSRQAGELEYQTLAYGDLNTGEFEWNE